MSEPFAPDVVLCNEVLGFGLTQNIAPPVGKYNDTFNSPYMNICLNIANQPITPSLGWNIGKEVYKGIITGSYPPPTGSNLLPPDFPPLITQELQSDVVTVVIAFVVLFLFFIVFVSAIVLFLIGLTGKIKLRTVAIAFVVIVVLAVLFALLMYWVVRSKLFPILSTYGQKLEGPLSIYAQQTGLTVWNYIQRLWNKGLKNVSNYLVQGQGSTEYNTAFCTGSTLGVPNIVTQLNKITNLTYCPNSCSADPMGAYQYSEQETGKPSAGVVFTAALDSAPENVIYGCFAYSAFANVQIGAVTIDGECGIPQGTIKASSTYKVTIGSSCVPPCPTPVPCSTAAGSTFNPYTCNLSELLNNDILPKQTEVLSVPKGSVVRFTWFIASNFIEYDPSQPVDGFIANSADDTIIGLYGDISTSFLPSPVFPEKPYGCTTVTVQQSALYTLFVRNNSASVGLGAPISNYSFHGLTDYARLSVYILVTE